jgi:hypothetical protein
MKADTQALVMVGRALENNLLVHGQLAPIRTLAATIPGLEVVVAADTGYDGERNAPTDDLFSRVVIGFVAQRVQSEYVDGVTADPVPLDREALAAAVVRAHAIDDMFWQRLGKQLPPKSPVHTSAGRRANEGVAFDGGELRRLPDRVFLVATGPLAGAVLARGQVRDFPTWEQEDEYFDQADWVFHGGNNERPTKAVYGKDVRRVHIEDRGAIALAAADLTGDDLYLLAVYD